MNHLKFCKKVIMAVTALSLVVPLYVMAADPAPGNPDKIALVNGKAISYKDFERKLKIFEQQVMRGQPGQLPDGLRERARQQVVHQLISEELLYQESIKQKLKLENGYVDNELKSLKERFGSDMQYQQVLKRMELTEDQLKDQIARQALIRQLVEKEVISKIALSKEDAKEYYQANSDKFRQPERVRAQHILIKVDPGADEQKKSEARKKLEGVKKRVLGGEDFGKLAKEYSEDEYSKVRDGDLGYFTRGRMVKSFEDAAFQLAPNEVSGIVETQFGYHLIKVLDHQAAKDPSFEEVEPQVMSILRNETIQRKLDPYILNLRQNAKVETFLN
jgi:peptidyl-prolyl cis-trans isomerase C